MFGLNRALLRKDSSNQQQQPKNAKNSKPFVKRLFFILLRLAAPSFVPAGICQLVAVLCQVALPLLVQELLRLLEEDARGNDTNLYSLGLPVAVSIFATSVINAFANHRHRHLAMKAGVLLRAGTVAVLYQHVLTLTPQGRASGLSSGLATTLVAVDTQKLFDVTQEGHLLWSLPTSILLVTICLVAIMGPVTLVGIAVLVIFVPIVQKVTSSVMEIRQQRVKFTDERIELSNAMIQGVSCCERLFDMGRLRTQTSLPFFFLISDQSHKTIQL